MDVPGWRRSKGGWQGIVRWVLVAARSSVGFGLALFAGVAALSAANFIQEVPDVRIDTEVARLIDDSAWSDYPPEVGEIVTLYNTQVREAMGEPRGDLTFRQLRPREADPSGSINPETDGAYVAFSQDLESWARFTESEVVAIPPGLAWSEVDGCDEGIDVLRELYGPVACLTPSGELRPLGESALPTYALALERLELNAESLETLLLEMGDSHYLEARLVVFNDGAGLAQDVQIAAPERFTHDSSASLENECRDSGLGPGQDFPVPEQSSCELVFVADPPEGEGVEAISGNLAFSVSASNSSALAGLRLNWILFGVGIATLLYFGGYLFATFSHEIKPSDLK